MTNVENAAGADLLRVALHHPMRIWVDSMQSLLHGRADVDLVAAHTSTSWVVHAVTTGQVDVVLLYVVEADDGFADLAAHLRAVNPRLQIVGLSPSEDPRTLVRAVRAGVRGWVEPSVSVDDLVATLYGVSRGETRIPPRLLTHVIEALLSAQETQEQLGPALRTLSAREIDILSCLVEGMSRNEIADRYVLSRHTVRTHINNLLRKLGVHSTLAAVSIAREAGLPQQRQPG